MKVIVVDLSNYVNEAKETVPFLAEQISRYDNEFTVKSLVTGEEYMIYETQILEYLTNEEIVRLINLEEYGVKG